MQELVRKGVVLSVAENAVESVVVEEEIDEGVRIERVAQRKLKALGKLEAVVLRRRLFAFLARRGYNLEEIKGVVARLIR